MPDYQPLDLSSFCNAGTKIYPANLAPPSTSIRLCTW